MLHSRGHVEGELAVSGLLQGADAGLEQLVLQFVFPGRPGQLQGGDVVMGEDLGDLVQPLAGSGSSQRATAACLAARMVRVSWA